MDFKKFTLQSLTKASKIAETNFGKVKGTTKAEDNNQVLTETDIRIGKLLVNEIEKRFPKHNIIDEEAGVIDKKSIYTWVVDPIDGTSNFAQGIPMYGILLGLLENNTPIVGGITLPSFSETYIAEKGDGSYCNGKIIKVSDEKKLLDSLVAYGIDGHRENPNLTEKECSLLAKLVLGMRNLRSSNSVYDYAMVAKGKYGGYLNQTSKIWDNVAAQVVIEEAGGAYTDFFGKPIDYSNHIVKADSNFTYCAAAPELHKQLQEIIHG
jgi:myo-inositol-1(or 4)-monophosphatase